jgi:hypothetical protein
MTATSTTDTYDATLAEATALLIARLGRAGGEWPEGEMVKAASDALGNVWYDGISVPAWVNAADAILQGQATGPTATAQQLVEAREIADAQGTTVCIVEGDGTVFVWGRALDRLSPRALVLATVEPTAWRERREREAAERMAADAAAQAESDAQWYGAIDTRAAERE